VRLQSPRKGGIPYSPVNEPMATSRCISCIILDYRTVKFLNFFIQQASISTHECSKTVTK